MTLADDFKAVDAVSTPLKTERGVGVKRGYLKVFETGPPQLLNAYGEAKFAKTSDPDVWAAISKALPSGAMYMNEFCSAAKERRGMAANRWLHAMLLYCQYQQSDQIRAQNAFLMKPEMLKELYAEIDEMLPCLQYCLAPEKVSEKSGAAALRAAAGSSVEPPRVKEPEKLDEYAKKLYSWLDTSKVSRIRMLAHWQSAGGLSFVSSVHHRLAQCFRSHGNSLLDANVIAVSLTDFQEAIQERHRIGSRGLELEACTGVNDFV